MDDTCFLRLFRALALFLAMLATFKLSTGRFCGVNAKYELKEGEEDWILNDQHLSCEVADEAKMDENPDYCWAFNYGRATQIEHWHWWKKGCCYTSNSTEDLSEELRDIVTIEDDEM